MRRLMKEFYSVRSELEARRRRSMHGSAEQQHYKPSANLHPRRSRQRGEILAFAQGAEQPQRSSGSSSIEGEAHPDLLELRPRDADQGDLFEWYAVIKGPDEGNYEGASYGVSQQRQEPSSHAPMLTDTSPSIVCSNLPAGLGSNNVCVR